MQARHLSIAILTLALVVGIAAGVALLVGFEPARLPAASLNIAVHKLTVLAACGLLASGAMVGRPARRAERAGDAWLAPDRPEQLLRDGERADIEVKALRAREADSR